MLEIAGTASSPNCRIHVAPLWANSAAQLGSALCSSCATAAAELDESENVKGGVLSRYRNKDRRKENRGKPARL